MTLSFLISSGEFSSLNLVLCWLVRLPIAETEAEAEGVAGAEAEAEGAICCLREL